MAPLTSRGRPALCGRVSNNAYQNRAFEMGKISCNVWIVPPRCLWIPGDLPRSMTIAGNVEVCCLFVDPDASLALPKQCCALSISPLLQHLLLHFTQMPVLYDVDGADGRVATVLLDQLSAAPVENINFPMPVDAKPRKIAVAMMADPADRATIDDWGWRMGIAPRTLTRILQRETGMSFGRWRQQLHILTLLGVRSRGPQRYELPGLCRFRFRFLHYIQSVVSWNFLSSAALRRSHTRAEGHRHFRAIHALVGIRSTFAVRI